MENIFCHPLKIDEYLTLPDRVLPAPMEGVMSHLFCRAAMDLELLRTWITPFISIGPNSVPSLRVFQKHIAPFKNEFPLIVQLLGHTPETLADASKIIYNLGVKAINLNMACPSGQVLSSGNGGACLKDPSRMTELLCAVRESVPDASVSVKIRSGWNSPYEIEKIISAIRSAGIRFIIMHFRTVEENYRDVERNESFRRIASAMESGDGEIILFGNGDILNTEDAFEMMSRTNCNGVAVGRGMMRDPFLLKKIRGSVDSTDKMIFLKKIYHLSKEEDLGEKWRKSALREYARLTFGRNSQEFRDMLKMDDSELDRFFT